ncbi:hypothetical protein BU26DRAFT_516982 [Trematosphaeria pertusa]|uniref:Uncharacterized protein n=1 Tax=Trematosphaeria pertusa TaxID=390896 RepID=A0A6A6IQI7_9PLEO|nr:uncharacterized protein BU26DRAFT_516982 [Trematosphaeria pertusa]KAF2252318.1 hypothetical protein BU26DRAFT_516982 [Trematosphaeria pertusa]
MAGKDEPWTWHDIGVMFCFLGFMLVCSVVFGFFWQSVNGRCRRRGADRIEQLRASGLLRGEKEGADGVGEQIEPK